MENQNEEQQQEQPISQEALIEQQRIATEHEANKTYHSLHLFDGKTIVVIGKGVNKTLQMEDYKPECDAVMDAVVAKGGGAFVAAEVKTVNIQNGIGIVVFVVDKDMLRLKYDEINSDLIEALIAKINQPQ